MTSSSASLALMKPPSATEIEVLWPWNRADIAASRNTTAQVIKNYTYRARHKLGADNRAHLIAVAFDKGSSNKAQLAICGTGVSPRSESPRNLSRSPLLEISTEISVLTSRESLTILTAQSCRLPARGGYEPPEFANNDSLSTICNVRLR
jgi:hypothetical protein